jgi:hypothetical protein
MARTGCNACAYSLAHDANLFCKRPLLAWRFQRDTPSARVEDASHFPEKSVQKTPLPLTTHQLHGDSLFWCSVTITSTRSARVGYARLFPAGGAQKTPLPLTTHQLHGDSLFWCSVTITSTRSARVGYASLFPEEGVQTTPLPLTIHQLYGLR